MKKIALTLLVSLLACAALAQSDPPAAPVSGAPDAPQVAPKYESNVRPLSGVQNVDLGSRTGLFNTLTPSFEFSESYGTNPGFFSLAPGQTVWGSLTHLGGSVELVRGGAGQQFALNYRGVAQINSYDRALNTQIHSLNLTESISSGRWNWLFGNQLTYQPYANAADTALLSSGPIDPGFRPGISPTNTILTAQNTSLNNLSVAQATYGMSRASSITGSVSYGLLHYLDADFLDTRQFNAIAGMDHRFGRNTIGLSYKFSKFTFNDSVSDFNSNNVELTFGRRVIGRMSVEIGAGPIFTTTTGTNPTTKTDVGGHASLLYQGNKSTVSLGYSRSVTAGSGIVPGALTDTFSIGAERRLSRMYSAHGNFGYARNSGTSASSDFNTLFATAGISRSVGRYMSVTMGYRGQHQTGNSVLGGISSDAAVISFQWNLRPIRLE